MQIESLSPVLEADKLLESRDFHILQLGFKIIFEKELDYKLVPRIDTNIS